MLYYAGMANSPEYKQCNYRLDPVLEKLLQEYADDRSMTLAEATRTILRVYLDKST